MVGKYDLRSYWKSCKPSQNIRMSLLVTPFKSCEIDGMNRLRFWSKTVQKQGTRNERNIYVLTQVCNILKAVWFLNSFPENLILFFKFYDLIQETGTWRYILRSHWRMLNIDIDSQTLVYFLLCQATNIWII